MYIFRYIQIGDPNETAAKNVTQHVIWTTDSNKRKSLQELLEHRSVEPPLMIFMNMKKVASNLYFEIHYSYSYFILVSFCELQVYVVENNF